MERDPQEPRNPAQADAGALPDENQANEIDLVLPADDEPSLIELSTLDRFSPWLKRFGRIIATAAGIATITFGLVLGYNQIRDAYDDRIARESELRRIEIDKVRDDFSVEDKALETRLREVEQELIRIQATLKSD